VDPGGSNASDPSTIAVSPRRRMVSAFQNLPVGLAAEDGAWLVPTAGRYAATQGRLVGL
jgi:hypothetical protein